MLCLGLALTIASTGCSAVCAIKDKINETYERERDAGRRLFPDTKAECEKAKEQAEGAGASLNSLISTKEGAELANHVVADLLEPSSGGGNVEAASAEQCSAGSVCSAIALCKSLGVKIPDGGRCS